MSFDYDKIKAHNDHGSWWTSYADLFMMLSIVFLLMFVASSLRSGSAGIQQQKEFKKLAQKAQDLEEQIKVYDTLKEDTLRQQSSESEQEVYRKLMGQLDLLQDEASKEKIALQQKAKQNEEKEFALNQYQQIIRNIINANVLAKTQIQRRDQQIISQDSTIKEKREQIAVMERTISQNNSQISAINQTLAKKIKALRNEQSFARITKAAMDKKIAALRASSANKIQELKGTNQNIVAELGQVKGTLEQTKGALEQTQEQLGAAAKKIEVKEAELGSLTAKLRNDRAQYLSEIDSMKQQHGAKMAAERAAFEGQLKKQQLSAAARAQKLAQYLNAEKGKAAELEGHLAGLRSKVSETEGKLASAESEKGRALASVAGLQGEVAGLKGDLARTQEIAMARKKLAEQIAHQFAKSGLAAAVDGRTGEVTLDFGGEYFDTGSTDLKPKMRLTMDKFMPVYARSLFNDPKISEKIASVEIVGFASSTYRGKYVNPKSTRAEDKNAIEYNLKLSFGRATSIFKHVLNQNNLSTADRDKLMPLLKVAGRGYLPEGKTEADFTSGMSEKEFCQRYNCLKAQKVVVKFNMKD